jgi:hypothetical protein
LADLVEHASAFLDLAEPHEGHADVVFRVADPRVARTLPCFEHRQRFGEPALVHQHLGVEHVALGLDLLRQFAGDARESRFRLR